MPAPRRWSPEEESLLGTMPDTEVARRLGIEPSLVNKRRKRLGIAPYVPPTRICRCCEKPADCRADLCHVHSERWRRWGKPNLEEWAAAFRENRLNTCDVCGKKWNGYHGCRHCSPECLATWKREAALARYHALPPEKKQEAVKRSLARQRERRREGWVAGACVICGAGDPGESATIDLFGRGNPVTQRATDAAEISTQAAEGR